MTPDRWKQIDALLDSALEHEPNQRAAFLLQACAGDEALRHEVEALLAAHDQAGSFLVSPGLEASAKVIVEVEAPSLVGRVIGPYQILSVLGKGGMGEVYLAQDTRLGRKIALKLLPSQFTQDQDRLRRFEREARAASGLNHPNILTIYEIGEQGSNIFIATEFIEGQTLRQRMAGERLQSTEVLDVAVQAASALATAHAAGIIHRDIKPENIMLRRDGFVKVLDFGLAKLSERQGAINGDQDAKDYWTETETGVLMGTTPYMSPEQARGIKLDARTDLFSLGVVMYEMIAGRPPFEGETATDVIIAIVETEPSPLSRLAAVPAEFERIVAKALSKNLEVRYQTASELENDLKQLKRRLPVERDLADAGAVARMPVEGLDGTVGTIQKPFLGTRWLERLGQFPRSGVGLLLLASLVFTLLVIWMRSPVPAPTVLSMIQITNDRLPKFGPLLTYGAWVFYTEEVGGRRIPVYTPLNGGGAGQIPMPLPSANLLDISQGGELLVASWSGDGRAGALWVLPEQENGKARKLGPANLSANEATWSPDGKKLLYLAGQNLHLAKSDGTRLGKLTGVPGHPSFIRWSPDSKRITVSVDNGKTNTLWEVSADGTNLHPVLPAWDFPLAARNGRWTFDGKYFLFDSYRGGTDSVWAIREKGGFFEKWSHEPVRLISGLMDAEKPLPSQDGKRVYFLARNRQTVDQLMRYDAKSTKWIPYLAGIAGEQVAFSKDGHWITYVSFPEANLIRSKLDGSQKLQLTSPPLKVSKPRWSPDGKRIAFMAKTLDKPWNILVVSSDGGIAQPLIPGDSLPRKAPSTGGFQSKAPCAGDCDPDWSPDGNSLVFYRQPTPEEEAAKAIPIHILDLQTKKVTRLTGSGDRYYPRWSPNGRYLAATADDCKKVALFDFKTQQWVVLAKGDLYYPSWSRDGQSVYFIDWGDQDQSKTGYYRFEIRTHKLERVTDLATQVESGTDGGWVGLAPDDSPIALLSQVGSGAAEIYAADWVAP